MTPVIFSATTKFHNSFSSLGKEFFYLRKKNFPKFFFKVKILCECCMTALKKIPWPFRNDDDLDIDIDIELFCQLFFLYFTVLVICDWSVSRLVDGGQCRVVTFSISKRECVEIESWVVDMVDNQIQISSCCEIDIIETIKKNMQDEDNDDYIFFLGNITKTSMSIIIIINDVLEKGWMIENKETFWEIL